MRTFCIIIFVSVFGLLPAQEPESLQWYKVGDMKLGGKVEMQGSNPFQRFPDSLKKQVREEVWDLSKNPAGVYTEFETNAAEIVVRYAVEGRLEFPHMPATGVSGVDLYSYDDHSWKWVKGNYNFQDTISYRYKLNDSITEFQHKLRLYLPLYNTVTFMEIGLSKSADFIKIKNKKKAPIVVYGTSITQGACAGRPGTSWTSILSRNLDIPLLNYGFSGNGRLEEEVIAYISQIDAEVFVLDCLANFTSGQGLNSLEARERLIKSVTKLRKSNPETPIILTDHAGYPNGDIYKPDKDLYLKLNWANQEAYKILKENGVKDIFLLKNKKLGLNQDDFIDGVHPNDAGMRKYAKAYLELLAKII